MKIRIEIDTTEKFSTRKNMCNLVDMVLEEVECSSDSGQTEYKSAGGNLQTCKYSVTVE